MQYRLFVAICFAVAVYPLCAHADTIFIKGRDKGILGDVKAESAKGVTFQVKKVTETFAGTDVLDVHYDDILDFDVRNGVYKVAKKADEDASTATDATKRSIAISTAIAKYNDTLKTMKSPLSKYGIRNIRYRIAILKLRQAQLDKASTAPAIADLQKFHKDFPDSWQINHVMPLIAQVQMDAGDYKGAMATFDDMALMDTLPMEVRLNAKLMIVQVAVRDGKIDIAQLKLNALEKEAAGNPKTAARVRMARAEVLVGQKKNDEAVKLLTDIVKESTDKDTKALAHNTLGECLFKANKFSEARWEFIWVDTVFNQDRVQHAKALYYLEKTFQGLNDVTRAQECRLLLLDTQFAGTEWQQKAIKEGK